MYFSPYVIGIESKEKVENEETYSIHWYTQNWNMSRKGYVFVNTKHINSVPKKIFAVVRKNIGYLKSKLKTK